MLYDPKWDVFTLQSLISWLEKQPGEEEYNYRALRGCLIARYLSDQGFNNVLVGSEDFNDDQGQDHPLPDGWNMIISVRRPWTFGAALERAKELLKMEDNHVS